MADQVKYAGRLIAVDGSRGKDVNASADALSAALKAAGIECAISRWDASGLFTELAAGARTERDISMRSLTLIYAADLAFRLRKFGRCSSRAGLSLRRHMSKRRLRSAAVAASTMTGSGS
jgi:hypothetical protein